MTYDIILTGGKTLSVNQEQKNKLDVALLDKDANNNASFSLGNNTIRLSMVKAIIESVTESYKPLSDKQQRDNTEWDTLCATMAHAPIQEKIDTEINSRILPMFWDITLDENTMAVLRQSIETFFVAHKNYPRCPSVIWWEIVKPFMETKQTLFMEYVIRNDGAIREYIKYHPE